MRRLKNFPRENFQYFFFFTGISVKKRDRIFRIKLSYRSGDESLRKQWKFVESLKETFLGKSRFEIIFVLPKEPRVLVFFSPLSFAIPLNHSRRYRSVLIDLNITTSGSHFVGFNFQIFNTESVRPRIAVCNFQNYLLRFYS